MCSNEQELDEQRERPAHVTAGRVRMRLEEAERCVLIVEGLSDKTVFENFIEHTTCEILVVPNTVSSRQTVIDVIEILNRDGVFGAIGIVDADFTILENSFVPIPNLFLTDGHDLENLIISSPALEKVIREYGQENKIASFIQSHGNIRDRLHQIAAPLGYLRWVNDRSSNLNLKFKDLRFRFINPATWTIDIGTMIEHVINNTHGTCPSVGDLRKDVEDISNPDHDYTHVCCGHDLVEILSIGLRRVLGTYGNHELKSDQIDRALRLAYEYRYFRTSILYRNMVAWEGENERFKLFADEAPSIDSLQDLGASVSSDYEMSTKPE